MLSGGCGLSALISVPANNAFGQSLGAEQAKEEMRDTAFLKSPRTAAEKEVRVV